MVSLIERLKSIVAILVKEESSIFRLASQPSVRLRQLHKQASRATETIQQPNAVPTHEITANRRQPNEDQDKHAFVRLAQISNLRTSKHGSRLYDKHDLIEYIEMPSKSESVNLLHLSYRDNQGRV